MLGDSPAAASASSPWWRVLGHVLAFAVVWPGFVVWFAPRQLTVSTLFNGISPGVARLGMLASLGVMWREVTAGVAVMCLVSLGAALLAGGLRRTHAGRARQLGVGLAEAAVAGAALLCGLASELPAALRHPALSALWSWRVSTVWMALALSTAGAAAALGLLSRRSLGAAARGLLSAGALVGLGLAAARGLPDGSAAAAGSRARILLGLDSISQADPIDPLREMTAAAGGTWYERATTPGLLTNAVWTSIVTSRLPSETGVFFTFQTPDWETLPPSLPARARAAGLHTCAFFSDQLTMQLGADLPFDENHSGPRGWLQVGTAAVKDTSFFLPIILAHLPPLPGASTPPNQGGTYTFSLARELSEILTCHAREADTLVLAHLDYLHQARYPSLSELTADERARVRAAPVDALVDESIHWQYPERADEPLPVYRWKLSNLQRTLRAVVDRTGVLDAARGNALLIFSDHGPRTGLTAENFGAERYVRVPLATFGIAPRDPARPISLLDLAELVRLAPPDRAGPAPAVVEYTTVTPEEWKQLVRGTRLLLNGRAELSPAILEQVGARLRRFDPWEATPQYVLAPALPVAEPADPSSLRFGGS